MKKMMLSGLTLGIALLLCACRSTVTVNGQKFAMVTDSEKEEMLTVARLTLRNNLNNPNVITVDEYQSARVTEPLCKIDYFGDLLGTARFTWDFPNRKTTVMIRGELTNPKNRLIAVSIVDKLPPIIDTTNQVPANAPVWKLK